jgi:hypothetical protein
MLWDHYGELAKYRISGLIPPAAYSSKDRPFNPRKSLGAPRGKGLQMQKILLSALAGLVLAGFVTMNTANAQTGKLPPPPPPPVAATPTPVVPNSAPRPGHERGQLAGPEIPSRAPVEGCSDLRDKKARKACERRIRPVYATIPGCNKTPVRYEGPADFPLFGWDLCSDLTRPISPGMLRHTRKMAARK